MMSDHESGGRLHIDADWKTEAAREKERLAEQEQKAPEGGASAGGPATFLELVNLIAIQAAVGLGGFRGPGGERISPKPAVAKHHIDLLDVLEQKTRGNLSEEEKRALDSVLYELRLQYVHSVSGPVKPGPSARS